MIIGITSYFLALFMSKYLFEKRPKLAPEELDTPKGFDELILSVDTVRSDRNIDCKIWNLLKNCTKMAQTLRV